MAEPDIGGRPTRVGESAQVEYERRAAKDAERRRAGRRETLVLLALAPFAGYLLVQLGGALLNALVGSTTSAVDATTPADPVFDGATLHGFGLLGALAATLWVVTERFGRRQSTEAWRVGAEGERRTGRLLESLPPGFTVFHDLRMPGSRANIDHVVVGPTGVFTVETKNYAKGVVIKGGVARSNGRKLDSVVEQATRQASVVSEWVGTAVTPIVCVHGAGLRVEGWFQKPTVGGVRFCSGGRLTRVLTKREVVHSADAVAALADKLGAR